MRSSTILLTASCALALTACGGGDGSSTAAPAAADEHAGHGADSSAGASSPAGSASDGHDHAHLDIPESGIGKLLPVGDGYGNLLREVRHARPPGGRSTVSTGP